MNDPIEEIVEKVAELGAQGAIVQNSGQFDVQPLLDAGWVVDPEMHVVGGKRIRILIPPRHFTDPDGALSAAGQEYLANVTRRRNAQNGG